MTSKLYERLMFSELFSCSSSLPSILRSLDVGLDVMEPSCTHVRMMTSTLAPATSGMHHLHRVQEWRVRWCAVNDHVLESLLHMGVDVGMCIIIDEVDHLPISHHLTCLSAYLGEELLETLKRCHCYPNRMMHQTDFIRNLRGDVAIPTALVVDHPSGRLSYRCSAVASSSPNIQPAFVPSTPYSKNHWAYSARWRVSASGYVRRQRAR